MSAAGRRPALLHLTSYAFTPRSHPGIHRQVLGLAPRFRSLVLCSERAPYHDAPLSDEERRVHLEAGVESVPIEFVKLRKPGQVEWLAAGVRARLGRPRALVAHLGNNGWRSLPLARALDVPVLTVFHGNDASVDLRDPEYAPRYRCLADAPEARFRGVSGNIVQRLVEFGFPAERCGVLHLGVDLGRFPVASRGALAPGPLRVVLAGRLLEFKGHRYAIEAFAALARAEPGSRLDLYGDGPLEGELRGRAAALGLGDAVRFHGLVPVDALRDAFREADVALQPSVVAEDGRSEGVPNTVLEALACGTPVVATRHAGIPEAVVHEETGLLVEERDAPGLAGALLRLARDPALRARLGAAGRAHVERHFDAAIQSLALADDLDAMARAYARLPRRARRDAWTRAASPLLDPPADYGPRYRAAWRWKTLLARLHFGDGPTS